VARLFISHSSANNAAALALCKWLSEQGFDDVFLDIDPERGLVAGQRWQQALKAAADRCEAVLFLVSPAWISSKWCLAEFLLAKTLHKRIFGLIVEPVPLDRVPTEMTAEWQLCQLIGADPLRTFDVSSGAERETVAFREAGLDLLRRGLERAGLDAKSFPWPPPSDPKRAPYRGLRALEPQDAAIFFGRDAAIVRGLDRIRGLVEGGVAKLFVVLGASGSGKSSFLRAGIWPRLGRDDLTFLPLPVIRPQSAVVTGSAGIASALSVAFERLGVSRPPGRIKEALTAGDDGLGRLLDELAGLAIGRFVGHEADQKHPTVVLAVDQAEELFNPEGTAEAATFLSLLGRALQTSEGAPARRVLVIATIRSDRYELLQGEAHLSAVTQDLFNLPPIARAEFKTVIEGPARRVSDSGGRLVIDPALTERLIADAQGADALPLLAFTLERLYADYGGDGKLTPAEYEKLGGVQGSIAEAVAQALAAPGRAPAIPAGQIEQLARMRAAFIPWLARIDPDSGEPMRRVARIEETPEGSRAIVQRLVEARLILADRRAGADIVEVAHESLLRQWPTLVAWLQADADDLKLVEGVERAAGEWTRNGRHETWLDHRGERLGAAEKVARRDDFRQRLGEDGLAYLSACRARDDAERADKEAVLAREQARLAEIAAAQERTTRLQRRTRWVLSGIAVAVAAGLALGWWQINLKQRALAEGQVNMLAGLAEGSREGGDFDGALRFAVYAAERGLSLDAGERRTPRAESEMAALSAEETWRLVLSSPDSRASFATFSPDGARIVTASNDATARIWDATTGKQVAVLRGHTASVLMAAFSADGSRIVTVSKDATAVIWDAATTKQLKVLTGHTNSVTWAAFNSDGSQIFTNSADGTARIWDVATGKQITVLHESGVFSPDGSSIVVSRSDHMLHVLNVGTGAQTAQVPDVDGRVMVPAFSSDGSRIVVGSLDGTAQIWDAADGKMIAVLRGHDSAVTSGAFSPDGLRVATASEDGTARIWDAVTGRQITILRGNKFELTSVNFSRDGARVVTAAYDGTTRIWDAGIANRIAVLRGDNDTIFSAAYSPDGSQIVTASWDKSARIWDTVTGAQVAVLRGHTGRVFSAAFSRDGSRIVTASTDKTARIWEARSGKTIAILGGDQGALYSAAFSPDGARVVTGSADGQARVWDMASGKQILLLRGHNDAVSSVAFSPDGSRIVTSSWDHTVRVWDASTGNQIETLSGHDDIVWTAAFSPDGSRIVTTSHDQTARVWDAATGQLVAILTRHDSFVTSAAYSPDGKRIATASSDHTARIWDAATLNELAVLRGHTDELRSVAFSPDGSHIVTGSQDKTAAIWNARFAATPTPDLIDTACTRLLPGLSKLTRIEMQLAGYPDTTAVIDVCAANE
jgi:WD40 repeat protein